MCQYTHLSTESLAEFVASNELAAEHPAFILLVERLDAEFEALDTSEQNCWQCGAKNQFCSCVYCGAPIGTVEDSTVVRGTGSATVRSLGVLHEVTFVRGRITSEERIE